MLGEESDEDLDLQDWDERLAESHRGEGERAVEIGGHCPTVGYANAVHPSASSDWVAIGVSS